MDWSVQRPPHRDSSLFAKPLEDLVMRFCDIVAMDALRCWYRICSWVSHMARAKIRNTNGHANGELTQRLARLEQELTLLRRQVQEPLYASSELPPDDFQALRCSLDTEYFGLPINWVREILRYVALTKMANAPAGVAGAINVRGEILPVIDTRQRLGLPSISPNLRTSIILVAIPGHDFGMLVDAVLDVVDIPHSSLSAPNSDLTQSVAIKSVATLGSQVVQLFDIARLLTKHQWEAIPQSMPNGKQDARNAATRD